MDVNRLYTSLKDLTLKSPVIAVSGTWGYGTEHRGYSDYPRLGAFVTKGITLKPRQGNPSPRLFETRGGLLNTIGLENVGVEAFLKDKLPHLPPDHPPVLVNVAGESLEDYISLARLMSQQPSVSGIELNVSCPNKEKGLVFGTDKSMVSELTREAKHVCGDKILIVKLTPNVTDIVPIAEAAALAGADALSLINTVMGAAIDWQKKAPVFHRVIAGLSGPAIKPVALAAVWRCYAALRGEIPLIGMGGIQTWTDALEFILAGATAVGVGTANFVDPLCCNKIIDGLDQHATREGISSLSAWVGKAHGA